MEDEVEEDFCNVVLKQIEQHDVRLTSNAPTLKTFLSRAIKVQLSVPKWPEICINQWNNLSLFILFVGMLECNAKLLRN